MRVWVWGVWGGRGVGGGRRASACGYGGLRRAPPMIYLCPRRGAASAAPRAGPCLCAAPPPPALLPLPSLPPRSPRPLCLPVSPQASRCRVRLARGVAVSGDVVTSVFGLRAGRRVARRVGVQALWWRAAAAPARWRVRARRSTHRALFCRCIRVCAA